MCELLAFTRGSYVLVLLADECPVLKICVFPCMMWKGEREIGRVEAPRTFQMESHVYGSHAR